MDNEEILLQQQAQRDQALSVQLLQLQMHYRERAVEHALELNKQQLKQQTSVEELVNNANAIYCFYKGNSK